MNKTDIKNAVLIIRRVPVVMAGTSFLNTLLFIFNIDSCLLSFLCGSSYLFIFVLWKMSKLFELCIYHKICLIYACIMETINMIDYMMEIPVSFNTVCYLFFFLSFIVFISVLILKKCNI